MTNDQPCAKCGSDRMVPRVRVMDRGHYSSDSGELSLVIYERPEARVFKKPHKGSLWARVCGSCGFTELYVDDPRDLYALYEASRE